MSLTRNSSSRIMVLVEGYGRRRGCMAKEWIKGWIVRWVFVAAGEILRGGAKATRHRGFAPIKHTSVPHVCVGFRDIRTIVESKRSLIALAVLVCSPIFGGEAGEQLTTLLVREGPNEKVEALVARVGLELFSDHVSVDWDRR